MLPVTMMSTAMSLIVCRSISHIRLFTRLWIYAFASAEMCAAFERVRAGAKRIMPIELTFIVPMSAILSAAGAIRPRR